MWQAGLKTGMYYLRTRAAADAIKFTVDQQALAKKRAERAAKTGTGNMAIAPAAALKVVVAGTISNIPIQGLDEPLRVNNPLGYRIIMEAWRDLQSRQQRPTRTWKRSSGWQPWFVHWRIRMPA